jgi:hypothetical protein
VSLGRFVPDHFDTAIKQATAPIACPAAPFACPTNASGANGLLYSGQAFTLNVTAKNAIGTGDTTANFQGVFAKATTLSAWSAAGNTGTANPGGGALANTALAATAFAVGVGTTPLSTPNTTQPKYTLANVATLRTASRPCGSARSKPGLKLPMAAYGCPMSMDRNFWHCPLWQRFSISMAQTG